MNIVTRGLGTKSSLITRGYGLFQEIVVDAIKFFVSAVVNVKELTNSIIRIRKL